jgi:rare lipoprotein A
MKSLASLALLGTLAAAPMQEPPAGDGPRGSSQDARFDLVAMAEVGGGAGLTVAAPGLDAPFAEVTALDTGRTVALVVSRDAVATGVSLSPAAARALGLAGPTAVRVRAANLPPEDVAALTAGRTAPPRADAPDVLLKALRRKLDPRLAGAPAPVAKSPRPAAPPRTPQAAPPLPPKPAPAAKPAAAPIKGGYAVQVAALSDAARARTLATKLGGFVVSGGGLHRVRIGPFADRASAAAAARAHAGAQIIRLP